MRSIHHSLLALAVLAVPTGQASAAPQDQVSREQASLAEEQAHLRRQLRRLKDTMGILADRLEREGRTEAAELLRQGLEHLDLRNDQTAARTLEELMDSSNEDLRAGRTNNALENQERIVQSLERLLNILMDRRGLENLDEEIDELRELRVALSELADEEAQIREETEQLREDSSNEAQQDLEQ